MTYCLDTSIIIYALKQANARLAKRLKSIKPVRIKIPEMVRAELLFGASKSAQRESVLQAVEAFLAPFERLPFGGDAVLHYAEIPRELEKKGKTIGPADLVIASTARAAGAALVTLNTREFNRVPNLQTEDWAK